MSTQPYAREQLALFGTVSPFANQMIVNPMIDCRCVSAHLSMMATSYCNLLAGQSPNNEIAIAEQYHDRPAPLPVTEMLSQQA
jgi:hypothetical protein